MPDQFDEAQRIADQYQADALAAHHLRVDEIRGARGWATCEECGEAIPQRRREAVPGCRLCVGCQRDFEADRQRGRDGA